VEFTLLDAILYKLIIITEYFVDWHLNYENILGGLIQGLLTSFFIPDNLWESRESAQADSLPDERSNCLGI